MILKQAHLDWLSATAGWMALSTVGPDGYPHTVPVGYVVIGDDVYIGCRDNTRKCRNIESNPKVSLMLENGPGKATLSGLLLQGDAHILRGEAMEELRRRIADHKGRPHPPRPAAPGVAYIAVRVRHAVTWDIPSRTTQEGSS